MNVPRCFMMFFDVRNSPFRMLYLCIVNARPRLRLRVPGITPTCTNEFSYVYPHLAPRNDTLNS